MNNYVKGYVLGSSIFKRGIILGLIFMIASYIIMTFTDVSIAISAFVMGAGLALVLFLLKARYFASQPLRKK
jgi:Ca2+/Na+ antiporter